jgi:hypothetical protein
LPENSRSSRRKKELKDWQKQARKTRWEAGAKDPALLKDINDIETAFQSSDTEAGRYIRAYRQNPETNGEIEATRAAAGTILSEESW